MSSQAGAERSERRAFYQQNRISQAEMPFSLRLASIRREALRFWPGPLTRRASQAVRARRISAAAADRSG